MPKIIARQFLGRDIQLIPVLLMIRQSRVCITKLTLNGHIKTAEQRTIIHQYSDWYTAVDGWAVTFGTTRRGLGELRPRPVPSSLYEM